MVYSVFELLYDDYKPADNLYDTERLVDGIETTPTDSFLVEDLAGEEICVTLKEEIK